MGNGDASVSPGDGILERPLSSATPNGRARRPGTPPAFRAAAMSRFPFARFAPTMCGGARMQIGDAIAQAPKKQKAHRGGRAF